MGKIQWVAVALLAQSAAFAAAGSGLEREFERIDSLIGTYYRRESPNALTERTNEMVRAFNEFVDRKNEETARAKETLDRSMAPAEALRAQVAELDEALKNKPSPAARAAVREYNRMVERRNELVARLNELNVGASARIKAYNALLERVKREVDDARSLLDTVRIETETHNERVREFEKADGHVRLFADLNRLLAAVKATPVRQRPRGLLERTRGLRVELGRRAIAESERREHGLVVIETMLGDEPVFFIVDTGASQTTLSPEVIGAAGLTDSLGEESEFVLAGGAKAKGRKLVLPALTVSGRTERNVSAASMTASDLGIDGLLGQSFLKRYVYKIDERTPEKLVLLERR